MNANTDLELLEAYGRERSEDAFRELVARHADLVYSAALRRLRNPQLAEEATQSAFIALANHAGRARRGTIVAGSSSPPSKLNLVPGRFPDGLGKP